MLLQEKKDALKEVLLNNYGWNEEEILEEGLENIAEDFLILTEEEAEEEARQQLRNLFNECGYNFINLNLCYYLDEAWFKEYFEESYSCYIEDIKYEEGRLEEEMEEAGVETEEEYLYYLVDTIDDYIEEFKFQYGEEELNEVIRRNPSIIDEESLIDDIILNDGRGSIISSYDGQENEVCINNEWYFIYKIN